MKNKKHIKIIITIFVVAAVLCTGTYYLSAAGSSKAKTTTNYQVAELASGNLTQSVTGTGTFSPEGSVSITVPFDLKITSVEVEAGQQIKTGNTIAILDTDALDTVISNLKNEISNIDNAIVRLKESESSTETIKSPISGRVKKIYIKSGDDVKSIMSKNNALFLISTDGKMNLSIEASDLKEGDSVTVNVGNKKYNGIVADFLNGKAIITITDNGPAMGAAATVYNAAGNLIDSGNLSINQPIAVMADAGTVSKIYVGENSRVYKNTSLAYLKNLPTSDEYAAQIRSRGEKQNLLITAQKMRDDGKIISDYDGIVNSISIKDGGEAMHDSEIISLYTDNVDNLTVSIDELDIKNIKVGQEATVAVDAIEDKTYKATVESISQVGTSNNGVTTYSVRLKVEGDNQIKIGMNATANIIVEKHADVLLLPIEALQSSHGEQYVWLYTGMLPEGSAQDPGKRAAVTTGLSNDNYVEITSGLDASDKVVIVRTRSSNTNSNRIQNGMMPGMNVRDFSRAPREGFPSGGSSPGIMRQRQGRD